MSRPPNLAEASKKYNAFVVAVILLLIDVLTSVCGTKGELVEISTTRFWKMAIMRFHAPNP